MTTSPILVTGGTGQVGIELRRRSPDVVAPDRAALDLDDPAALAAVIASRPWAAIINAAAYTAVDKAESDVAAAWRLNAVAPAVLATESAKAGIPLIHVSTDYVFDGSKAGFYLPGDPTGPLGVYGASKLAGEIAVRSGNPRHAILRTAWVVSAHLANFVKTMLRLGAERDHLRVVADQHGCPTTAADIADTLLTIAARMSQPNAPSGTWHFVNAGEATWHELAEAVFAGSAARGSGVPRVEAITTADYPTPARRPANSRLDTATLTRDFGVAPRPWRIALDDILAELLDAPAQHASEEHA
jgi:dTDP-4-dehydrorhamnose reductase